MSRERAGGATIDVTVVVPTRNRAPLLRTCLDALAQQRTSARFEVVVVDNGSQDDTGVLVRTRERSDPRFRVIEESVVGLSRAKNAGIASARGELVLFTDDDVLPSEGWIETFVDFFRAARTGLVLAGGPVLPVAHDLGPWPASVGASTADLPRLYHGATPRRLGEFEWLWGANMGAPRRLFETIGRFDESLGNVDDQRGTFEDVELVQRVAALSGECWYLPDAVVLHRTSPAALRPRALAVQAFARGTNDVLRSRRSGYVERSLPVPRTAVSAAAVLPASLVLWILSAAAFRLTRSPAVLRLARRLAWGAGWCAAAATSGSTHPAARAGWRLTIFGRRLAIALTPP